MTCCCRWQRLLLLFMFTNRAFLLHKVLLLFMSYSLGISMLAGHVISPHTHTQCFYVVIETPKRMGMLLLLLWNRILAFNRWVRFRTIHHLLPNWTSESTQVHSMLNFERVKIRINPLFCLLPTFVIRYSALKCCWSNSNDRLCVMWCVWRWWTVG